MSPADRTAAPSIEPAAEPSILNPLLPFNDPTSRVLGKRTSTAEDNVGRTGIDARLVRNISADHQVIEAVAVQIAGGCDGVAHPIVSGSSNDLEAI